MRLVILSYKRCWISPNSSSGYFTIGGFIHQIKSISQLFDETVLMLPVCNSRMPKGASKLIGHNLVIHPLEEPAGRNLQRKAVIPFWLSRNLSSIWREIREANGVHTPIPGDIGTIGILVALYQKKPLFVRHCGTWGNRTTAADKFLMWLLPRIAGKKNVVMATGGGNSQPSVENPGVTWIFATTISKAEWAQIPERKIWRQGKPLKLITVSRLDSGKNTEAVVRALPIVRKSYHNTTLEVVGDGPCMRDLKELAKNMGLKDCVTFHGRLTHREIINVLSDSDLFVFPTRVKEGFPKAVLEAMACGLPVIATNVSVIPHLIENRNGIVLASTEPEAVSSAILEIISDESRFEGMSRSARQTSYGYTLDQWQAVIRDRLTAAWGPLKHSA